MLLDARTPAGLDAALAPAAACLRAGGLIGLPTETVYGWVAMPKTRLLSRPSLPPKAAQPTTR